MCLGVRPFSRHQAARATAPQKGLKIWQCLRFRATPQLDGGPKKRIRGKRARARQRPRAHDLRGQYRPGDLADSGRLAIVSIDDPFSEVAYLERTGELDPAARLQQVRHADGSRAEGAPEWHLQAVQK